MTQLLKQAFAKASKLPPVEQNVIARRMIDEITSEKKWDESFAESESSLSTLASEALKEHRQGKTKRLDPDKL